MGSVPTDKDMMNQLRCKGRAQDMANFGREAHTKYSGKLVSGRFHPNLSTFPMRRFPGSIAQKQPYSPLVRLASSATRNLGPMY
jgi:hypothetical protein